MKIVADENIPFVAEAFSHVGEVQTASGREMNAALVHDADILLVRSITQVNDALLAESDIQFVATATIGTDHIDFAALEKRGITFASAPGSNAESVAQYVTAALLVLAEKHSLTLQNKTIGVVGAGNVGSRVARNAKALGMQVLLCDPPLQRQTNDAKYLPLNTLYQADFITLHTPLVSTGEDATVHLVGSQFLQQMKPTAILMNTSRGAVIDNNALCNALKQQTIADVVLDVWEHEPNISTELLKSVTIGTPHIAGYSFDGKVRGTKMIYTAACEHFGISPLWDEQQSLPSTNVPSLVLKTNTQSTQQLLTQALFPLYNIQQDDARLRETLTLPEAKQPLLFDRLRKEYPRRRECCNTTITLEPHSNQLATLLKELQFMVK